MRRRRLLITCGIILLLLVFLRWLFALFVTLWHLNSSVVFALLVDYFGLPSTMYMQNVSCPGCNEFGAHYLIKPRETTYCTHDKPVFLMVLVISQPDKYNRRMAIRQSWGSIAAHVERSIRTFFVCGWTANSTVQVMLENEAKHWNDVLQVWYLMLPFGFNNLE